MTRQEFDRCFGPMTKALQVSVVKAQTDYFFDEFKNADPRDFGHACRELAMGNPGFLPKLPFFRENVAAAKELRLEREKDQEKAEVSKFWRGDFDKAGRHPHDVAFGKCCVAIIKFRLKKYGFGIPHEHDESLLAIVRDKLQDESFIQHTGPVNGDWLRKQIET